MNMVFLQIGCGNSANYAGLVKENWADHFDLPGIPHNTRWDGALVDVQPHSVMKMVRTFSDSKGLTSELLPRLTIINAAVAGTSRFSQLETRDFDEVDLEARLIDAGKYNDKIRPNFKPAFFCHTITLNQLFSIFPNSDLINFVAFDVQGSEVDIFRSYDWDIKPLFIDIEPHSEEAYTSVADVLRQEGYSYVRRRPDGRRRVNHLWRRQTL